MFCLEHSPPNLYVFIGKKMQETGGLQELDVNKLALFQCSLSIFIETPVFN